MTKNIKETFVSMHIIGKISDESHIYLSTIATNVNHGKQRKIQKLTRTVVNWNIDADLATVGRSLNIILFATKHQSAVCNNKEIVKNFTALTITMIKKNELYLH